MIADTGVTKGLLPSGAIIKPNGSISLTGGRRDDIFISSKDAARLRLRSGDGVRLRSETGSLNPRAGSRTTTQGAWRRTIAGVIPN